MTVQYMPTYSTPKIEGRDPNNIAIVDIQAGTKMNWNSNGWTHFPSELKDFKVIVNLKGEKLAYCKGSDKYCHFEEMAKDSSREHGIRQMSRPYYNSYKSQTGMNLNGSNSNPQSTLVKDNLDKQECLDNLEEIWNNSSTEHTIEKLTNLGINDLSLAFIYISRLTNVSEELKNQIDSFVGRPIEPFYVGQTLGNDPNYYGSGTKWEEIVKMSKNFPDTKLEIRIVKVTHLPELNQAEYEFIKKTGATILGANESCGTDLPNSFTIKSTLDLSDDNQMSLYLSLMEEQKNSDIPKEKLIVNWALNGMATESVVTGFLKDHVNQGDIFPFLTKIYKR